MFGYRIAFIGDQHGNTSNFYKLIDYIEQKNNPDLYIQVGDLGLMGECFPKYLNKINKKFKSINKKLFFIDGNHENHKWLSKQLGENDLTYLASNVAHIKRGSLITLFNKNFLFIGGAYSIDRAWRKLNKSYWLEETITNEDIERALSYDKVDILVSHDCPDLPYQWFLKHILPGKDDRNSYENRNKLQMVWDNYKPKLTIHGHYHFDYTYYYGDYKFIGLNCDSYLKNFEKQFYILEV